MERDRIVKQGRTVKQEGSVKQEQLMEQERIMEQEWTMKQERIMEQGKTIKQGRIMKRGKTMKQTYGLPQAILAVACLLIWIPLLLMAAASLMPEDELYWRYLSVLELGRDRVRAALLPSYPSAESFIELLIRSPGFFVMFWNSVFQVVPMLAGQLVVAAPAAWAFARFSFKGKRLVFGIYVLLMVLPFQVTQVSNYLVLDRIGLLDSHLAMILPGIWSTLPVYIMTKTFETIPGALMEAAYLDGAGEAYTFLHTSDLLTRQWYGRN